MTGSCVNMYREKINPKRDSLFKLARGTLLNFCGQLTQRGPVPCGIIKSVVILDARLNGSFHE